MNIQEYLQFGLNTIKKSRTLILEKANADFQISQKADKSIVTEVDQAAEKLIRQEIKTAYPDHGILGEEYGTTNESSDFQWILDPIDGTISFSHGIPLYGTILALHYQNEPIIGIIDHPGINHLYYAAKNQGAFHNHQPIKITDINSPTEIPNQIIGIGDIAQFTSSNTLDQYHQLIKQHQYVRTTTDCFGHTLAAQGSIGAMVDFRLNPWDTAATKILIEEAGGKFLLLRETPTSEGKTKQDIIIGKPTVVDWLAKIFQ